MTRTNAHITVGPTAAVARVRVQQGLGYGWPTATFPCDSSVAMAVTSNKRQPRRLGQRST